VGEESKDIEERLRMVEQATGEHISAYQERTKHMDAWMERNDKDHRHISEHLDEVERMLAEMRRAQERTSTRVGMMIAGASTLLGFVYFFLGR
jgi:hypothetical protein